MLAIFFAFLTLLSLFVAVYSMVKAAVSRREIKDDLSLGQIASALNNGMFEVRNCDAASVILNWRLVHESKETDYDSWLESIESLGKRKRNRETLLVCFF